MSPSLKRIHSDTESVENELAQQNKHVKKSRRIEEPEELSDIEDIEINLDGLSDEESLPISAQSSSKKTAFHESGTIGRVEMVNFMCHPYLRIDLGPKVNFVIGHNGSGKSAILTAITVALGAKANSTNRGKKLSSLIREGANAALVTVHITNKGPDAYRHDVFGDTIIVERKILKDGVGNYRIKTLSGKVVSTKREELTALLDHMVIQVDNQLVILTQDMAREFLNSSSPNEKYKLFMRGTQLAELAEDYAIVRETLDTMGTILKRKEQSLPDLQRRAKEAFQRFETVKTLSTVEDRLEELSNELSWSQVIAKEKEEKAEIASLERAKAVVSEAKEKLAAAEKKVAVFDQEIQEINQESDAYKENYVPISQEMNEVQNMVTELQSKRNEIQSDVRDINTRVQSYKATIKNFEKKIAEHTAREANSQSIRSSLELQLEELGEEKIEKEEELNKSRNEFDRLENDKIRHINNKQNAIRSMDIAQKKIDQQRNNITELQSLKSNRLRAYGQYVPEVLEDIEKETRWRRKPVGPLGRYVKLKYQEYRDTMEIVLGRYLNAFLVEHTEDRRLLMSILERRRMRDTMVLVASYDLFDFSSGEPDEQYLTVLRALEFEDEWVKRQLIIGLNIEKILLIAERAKADEVMKNGGPANVKSCFTAQAQRVGSARGKRVEALNKYTGPQRFKQEIDSDISEATEELIRLNQNYQELIQQKRACNDKVKNIYKDIQKQQNKQTSIEGELRQINSKIRMTEEKKASEQPLDVLVIVDEKKKLEENIVKLSAQYLDLKKKDDVMRDKLMGLATRIQDFEQKNAEYSKQLEVFRESKRKTEEAKRNGQEILISVKNNYEKEKQRLKQKENTVKTLRATVADWTKRVHEEWPVRVETNRSPFEIQRDIDNEENRLKVGTEALGCSIEEAELDAKDKLQTYDDAKKAIRMMEGLRKFLGSSLDQRMDRWSEFRMFITLAAKAHFTYYLHKRGDSGYLKFQHDKEKLVVRVSTADQFQKGSTRHKDSKSLSGGEKSYSQISLLLAMWQGIASPLVCLDEFDVYMDAVNRKQSMRMLMETALEQSDAQYIFITPQDASNMKPGPFVKVHRLNDPNRRQTNETE